jgi:deazaflavin-dependent oxidoreductase (nitroreductase family)
LRHIGHADPVSKEADVLDDARVAARDEADPASKEAHPVSKQEHKSAVAFSSRGNTKWIVVRGPLGRAFDRLLVRVTGFSVITWQYAKAGGNAYQPTLLLTTIGRKSGKLRTRALPYYSVEEGRWVVIGSNGGGPRDPDWAWNVRTNSSAWVCVGRRRMPARAHVAAGAERQRLFDAITAQRDSLARYQERASTFGREVPLVVLEPIVSAS